MPIDLPGYQPAMQDQTFTLSEGQVDLWLIRSPGRTGGAALDISELDEAEQRRADSFVRPADGLLYTTAHVALRRLLTRYTGIPPRELRFVREPCPGCGAAHGRPALKESAAPLHFSLSHSDGTALVGIAAVPIGVDTERLPSREMVEDCSQELHPAERSELAAAGVEEQKVRFGQIWTRKEAFLKGIGTGLSRSLSEDYLGADVERHPPGWFLIDVTCGPTHCAAAAIRGPAPSHVNLRRMPGQWLGALGTEADTNAFVPFTPVLAC
ncbi:4'-phosphopantetheinyl transferase superfamily protein (plasmid) [Streptomyces sp. NBC_00868]|uniref:4'-phosphopantetheinyl transferase family protein n=1 Tax=Streptomyces sp. NBC_00868 TaxID=2903683 RepID=UPI00386444FE|nr:4'-phosphopantetheinyl transferase superfamily protein [Streptomyces sp. NBC_00868]